MESKHCHSGAHDHAAACACHSRSHEHEHAAHHDCCCSHEHGHDHHRGSLAVAPIVVSAVMLVVGLVAGWLNAPWMQGTTAAIWYVVAFVPVGYGVMRDAALMARHGDVFNEFMLMSLAAIGALAIGEYPEAVAVMLLYQVGEAFQHNAVDRARRSISAMVAFRPDHATVVGDGGNRVCRPDEVAVGDIIEVKPGERVPLDGELLGSAAAFDTSALTGESMPRVVSAGDEVSAGMIASDTAVRLRVVRPASSSAVSRILRLVEEASSRKAPTELFIRRFARIYTPVVFALAVLVVAVPWLLSLVGVVAAFDFSLWLSRALVFLVISCPCALVISVPLAYFAGIGAASRRGILFKGGGSLDSIAAVDTVAFDKTGTLTCGRFEVSRVEGLSDADVAMVAAMERRTSHPVASAIMAYASRFAAVDDIENVVSVAGYGLRAGDRLVGSPRLLEQNGVGVPAEVLAESGTVVAVAVGGEYRGCMVLNDVVRPDARRAIDSLNLHTVILSGDRQMIVDTVAAAVGADMGHGDMLPADKAACIADMQREGRKVAFVGDGINDAPVLATADVGIAFGEGSADMAVETADAVVHAGKLDRIAEAVNMGRRTRTIVKQNICMAVGFKVVVMALGLVGIANIWMAVFADTGVALLAVLNSMRIFSTHNK